MTFVQGVSGNPGGRPKTRHLTDILTAELAKASGKSGQTREQRMIERLVTIAITGKRSEAIQAMKLIFAYRDGLPVQPIELEIRRAAEAIAARTGADTDWLVKRAEEIAAEATGVPS
jgi:hypothetical protein